MPPGLFLQPGIKATVENGAPMYVPYVVCLANACVAGTVADPSFVRDLEAGRVLALEAVNPNVLTVIASLPLDNFAKLHQGAAAQTFEQKLEGEWEQPVEVARNNLVAVSENGPRRAQATSRPPG